MYLVGSTARNLNARSLLQLRIPFHQQARTNHALSPLGCPSRSANTHKIIQYINLIKSDDTAGSHGSSFTTDRGGLWPWLSADEFEYDYEAGHGTHTAGSAAGSTLNTPAETVTCAAGRTLSCVGGCIDDDPFETEDDLVTTSIAHLYLDIDRLCPEFGCDPEVDEFCLSDDVSETLTNHGGMAQGAKLAIFDGFYEDFGFMDFAGNGLWETCADAGCKLHSNSWGADYECEVSSSDTLYDDFMYQVRFSPEQQCSVGSHCSVHDKFTRFLVATTARSLQCMVHEFLLPCLPSVSSVFSPSSDHALHSLEPSSRRTSAPSCSPHVWVCKILRSLEGVPLVAQ